MTIGISIDGVLTNLEQFQFDYGSKFSFEHEMELRNPKAYLMDDIFRCHGNYLQKNRSHANFWDEYIEFYFLKEKARPFASEIIRKLHEEGYKIYLFCNRCHVNFLLDTEKIRRYTRLWLMENNIYYDFLVFANANYADISTKYQLDLFVDHNPKSILKLSTNIPIVCFHAKYNELVKGENIYRVFSWYDFYEKIELIWKNEEVMDNELSSFN